MRAPKHDDEAGAAAQAARIMTVGRRAEWIPVLWVMLLLNLCCSSQGLVSDGKILLEFKSKIFDRFIELNSWGRNGSQDPCETVDGVVTSVWAGVTCSNMTGSQVSRIELRFFRLASDDISVLANLTNLYRLDLRDNSFSGTLPDFSKLESLSYLYLGRNQFQGRLPDRFPRNLTEVDFGSNLFTGEISPNNNLFRLGLRLLDLNGNTFSGQLPDFPGRRVSRFLDVSGNQFEGPLPSQLRYLDLQYCNMSGNIFTGNIEVDQITGWTPSGVLDLSKNRLTGNIPPKLFTSSTMTFIDLSDNELEGPFPSEISEEMRATLQFLYLQNNKLSIDVYQLLRSNFSRLVELSLHDNSMAAGDRFNVTLHSGANEDRSGHDHGEYSWLDNTLLMSPKCSPQFEPSDFFNYTETSPVSAVNGTVYHPQLRLLDVSNCDLEGRIPSDIFNPQTLPSLKLLDLSGNSLDGRIPVGLTQMPGLLELRLARNLLNGHLEDWLNSSWTNLEVLDISDNCVWFNTSEAIEDVMKFPHLKQLRLGSNSVIEGTHLPALVGLVNNSLDALEVLDLSHLYLVGNISLSYSTPEVLPSLRYLDLSQNLLVGTVSGEFGQMPSLTYLNLSHNSLSGEIPKLPTALLNRDCFVGNRKLCGPPLGYCVVSSGTWTTWKIVLLVGFCVLLSGCSSLVLGWIWFRRIDAKKHRQDAELIAALLDRDTTTLMPLRELRKATEDFSDENQVGVGGFGTVYRGVLEDGTVVAIKKSKRDASTSEDKCQFLNEVKILSQVHHRNLVRLLGCCLANRNALLVFEFVSNGTLEEHLRSKHGRTPLSWNQRLVIAIQTATALDYLHSYAAPLIYHLDVKSANILLDDNLNAKVADFGISKLAPAPDATHITTLHGFKGTFGYMDPEMLLKSVLTDKSDVYAFGVVLLELITTKVVMDRSREEVSLAEWARTMIQIGRFEEMIDPVILDTFRTQDGKESIDAVTALAMECLVFQSQERPTMRDTTRDLLCIQQTNRLPSGRV